MTPITKESLTAFGMNECESNLINYMEKIISVPNDDDEGTISICLTGMRNQQDLALFLPDGGIIYLNINSIEELEAFEKCILEYEPNY